MIKESILYEDITVLNMYVPSKRSSKENQKLTELKGEIDKFSAIVGNFKTSISEIGRPSS